MKKLRGRLSLNVCWYVVARSPMIHKTSAQMSATSKIGNSRRPYRRNVRDIANEMPVLRMRRSPAVELAGFVPLREGCLHSRREPRKISGGIGQNFGLVLQLLSLVY